MKNPFERWIQPKELSPEQAEHAARRAMAKELEAVGTNYAGMHNAYRAAKELREKKGLSITRNHLLNLLREEAYAAIDPVQEELQQQLPGPRVEDLIDQEIETIRKEEEDEPQ